MMRVREDEDGDGDGQIFYKLIFVYATNVSVQKFCANNIVQKPPKNLNLPKKCKTVVNCEFLRSKAQILRPL